MCENALWATGRNPVRSGWAASKIQLATLIPSSFLTVLAKRRRFSLWLAVLAALSAALVLRHQSTHGVRIMFMASVNYVSVARSLLDGEGFIRGNGTPYETFWPPGYPLRLALTRLGLVDPLAVVGSFNAALHGAPVFAAGHWLRQRIASRFLDLWGSLALAGAGPWLYLAA